MARTANPDTIQLRHVVTFSEAALQLGVSRQALNDLRIRHAETFPEPVRKFGPQPVFDIRAMERWHARHMSSGRYRE